MQVHMHNYGGKYMRIYGLHSGRNKPAYYIARSYMWASRQTNNTNQTASNDKNLTGKETTVTIKSDFSSRKKENTELETACTEWLKNNGDANSVLGWGIIILLIGLGTMIASFYVGIAIMCIGGVMAIGGGINTALKNEAQELCKPTVEYDLEGESVVDKVLKNGVSSSRLMTYGSFTANAKAKVNSGATNIYDLQTVAFSVNRIPFLNVNVPVYCLKSVLWELYVLPDMCIYKEGVKVHSIDLTKLKVSFSSFDIRMPDNKPNDCEVISNTWLYVNKNGSPDRRYSNNRIVPICRLGEFSLTSDDGLNIRVLSSNYSAGKTVHNAIVKQLAGL